MVRKSEYRHQLVPKFNYYRLRNGKVLGIWKSDNNKNHNVRSIWGPVSGSENGKYTVSGKKESRVFQA